MKEGYLASVLRFAVKGFVFRTDAMQIILASLVPAYFQLRGMAMPDGIANIVLTYIAYGTVAFVMLRFVTAPYFIWKEQNAKIFTLQDIVDEPKRLSAKRQAEYTTELKLELSKLIGSVSSFALEHGPLNKSTEFWSKIQDDIDLTRAKASELSHNEELWGVCNDTIHFIGIVLRDKQEHRINQEDRDKLNELSKKTLKLLQSG
jgi:hypothetical protein